MGLFSRLFVGSRGGHSVGDKASKLVLDFLESSDEHEVSASTFTELFGFVYFEIDSVLFGQKIYAREAIASTLSQAYLQTLQTRFGESSAEAHRSILNQRLQEYGAMLRLHKQISDIVEKLDFYLNQASGLGEHHRNGEAPVVLGDVFSMIGSRVGLTHFCNESLAPFIKGIVDRYK